MANEPVEPKNLPDRANADAALALLRINLASTPAIKFLNAIWATRSIQAGTPNAGAKVLSGIPDSAKNAELWDSNAVYPWELELLVNERLALPYDALFLVIAMRSWNEIAGFVNLVRHAENEESGYYNKDRDIVDHLFRIAGRQFRWQQGFLYCCSSGFAMS